MDNALRKIREKSLFTEIRLFLHALRLTLGAQALRRGIPLRQVAQNMLDLGALPYNVSPKAAIRATSRAISKFGQRLGLLDTCLVRALVLGTLLADQQEVNLHIGFRVGEAGEDLAYGHAWITMKQKILWQNPADIERYREAFAVSLARD